MTNLTSFRERIILCLALLTSTVAFQPLQIRSISPRKAPPKSPLLINNHSSAPRVTSTALQAAPIVLPAFKTVTLSCLIPTSLGFIKSEYGVSYGYGTSVALVASLVARQVPQQSLAYWHAMALVFYGVRLNLFLLYRELCIPYFRKFREKIEEQSPPNRVARLPIVVSCATLYACLASPLLVTARAATSSRITQVCVGGAWVGFVLAALGDLQKSYVKARKGDDTLVTGGIYKLLRHPNYTGETLGWTCSFLAALSAGTPRKYAGLLAASALGWMGILLVLCSATSNLEKKQKEKYGNDTNYQMWVDGSWAGVALPKTEKEES